MYKAHRACNPPSSEWILWRYMDFTKFVSLLEKRALFFARADKLEDSFEGYLPNLKREEAQRFFDGHDDRLETMFNSIKESSRYMLINCWHESDHESAAMWKLYAKDDNGIAIKTDFDSLAKSFTSSQDINIGRISYIDYETDPLPHSSLLNVFLCKRKSFEHEHEVRAIVQLLPPDDRSDGKEGRMDLSQDICDVGNYYEIDLSRLIKKVIVSPYAPDWLLELIKSVAVRYNLKAPVVKSKLADLPAWGKLNQSEEM